MLLQSRLSQAMKLSAFALLIVAVVESPRAAGQPIYAADSAEGPHPSAIWRLEDLDGDGQALGAGERKIFRDASGVGVSSSDFRDVAVSRSGNVYTLESGLARVLRLRDGNNDGDAQDASEATIFRDLSGAGLDLAIPLSIAVTQTYDEDSSSLRDVVYVYDAGIQAIVRLEDTDNDGDAQGSDEICFYHHSSTVAPVSPLQMATDEAGRILSANHNRQNIVRLVDLTGDCHVNSGRRETACPSQHLFNEYQLIRSNASTGPDYVEPYGIGVTSRQAIITTDIAAFGGSSVLRLEDLNNDYNMQSPGEATVFSSGVCAEFDFRAPGPLAIDAEDAVHVSVLERGAIIRLQDQNGDDDAEDIGECVTFADDFNAVSGLAALLPPLPPVQIDLASGIEPLGKGNDLLVPDGASAQFLIRLVDQDKLGPAADRLVFCDSPSGCIECTPRAGRTDTDGRLLFTVSRVGPPHDETLIVSTLGTHEIINVPAFIPEEDSDRDGVPDSRDNCPDDANADQANSDADLCGDVCDWCPDLTGVDDLSIRCHAGESDDDGDGIGNSCDTCPNDADNDIDGDGVCGDVDNCPDVPNPGQEDEDGDGIGDACDTAVPCPLPLALVGDAARGDRLRTLYELRDRVLRESAEGARYVDLFYRHSPEVYRLAVSDPVLRREMRSVLESIVPLLRKQMDGEDVTLTRHDLRQIQSLILRLQDAGSEALRTDLDSVRVKLSKGKLTELVGVELERR